MFNVDFEEIKKSGTKGVLLDLDNTLYAYQPCHEYALASCAENFQKSRQISSEEFEKIYKEAQKETKKWTSGQAASHSRLLYFQRFSEIVFGRTDTNFAREFEDLYWQAFFEKMKIFPGVRDFLEKCRGAELKICLITDLTARIQFEKIAHLRIGDLLDFVVSSEEAGRDKPDEDIFRLALKKIGLPVGDLIMIGDNPEKDLTGAEKLGIRTILVNAES